jgi:hypothetical protein
MELQGVESIFTVTKLPEGDLDEFNLLWVGLFSDGFWLVLVYLCLLGKLKKLRSFFAGGLYAPICTQAKVSKG